MATFTIQILNSSGFSKSYVIFFEPPQVQADGASPTVFANAWVTFSPIANGSFDQLTYDDRIDAFWGRTPSQLAPGVTVGSGGSVPVDTSSKDGVTFTGAGSVGFGTVSPDQATVTGAYMITSESDFNQTSGYVFGMSKPAQTPIAAPVATFLAEPNENYNIIPVVKFYVADGAYTVGEVIDVKSASANAGVIDFTGLAQTTATATQGSNGLFSVQYS